jgi:hypothetical protein
MSKAPETTDKGRRNFLKMATVAAPATVAAATLGGTTEAVAAEVGDTVLRDTEHTRNFYASARF